MTDSNTNNRPPEYQVADTMTHSITVNQPNTTPLTLALENAELGNARIGTVDCYADVGELGGESRLDIALRVSVPEADAETLIEGNETTAVEVTDSLDEIGISGDAGIDLSDHVGNGVTFEIELLVKRFWG